MIRDLADWAKDRLRSDVEFRFDLKDRLKILFGWKLTVRVETDCEQKPGRVESETTFLLLNPRPRRSNICFVAKERVMADESEV